MNDNIKPPADNHPAHSRTCWIITELVLLISILIPGIIYHKQINHDVAMYVQCAQLTLEGQLPYVDFIDLNPPLIIYLNIPHVLVGKLFGVPSTLTFKIFAGLLVLLSWMEIRVLLPRIGLAISEESMITIAWISATMILHPSGQDWGQREHLFMLLYMPFIFLRLLEYQQQHINPFISVLIGVQAAFGILLKPHFVLVASALELVFLFRSRHFSALWSPGIISLVLVGLIYAAHWIFVPDKMRHEFFLQLVPMLHSSYRKAYGCSYIWTILRLSKTSLAIGGTCIFLSAWLFYRRSLKPDALLITSASLVLLCLLVYILQQKGWLYHQIPFAYSGCLLAAVLLIQVGRDLHETDSHLCQMIAMSILLGTAIGGFPWAGVITGQVTARDYGTGRLAKWIIDETAPKDEVLFISTSVTPAYPALCQTNRRPGSRYLWFFPIAFFNSNRDDSSSNNPFASKPDRDLESRFISDLRTDICRRLPKAIVIPIVSGLQGCPPDFNMIDYLVRTGVMETIQCNGYKEVPSPLNNWVAYKR